LASPSAVFACISALTRVTDKNDALSLSIYISDLLASTYFSNSIFVIKASLSDRILA
jgi:hypothetical protein